MLDIMRDITRNDADINDRRVALALIEEMRTGRLRGWLADQVRLEFEEHVVAIEEQTEKALARLRKQLALANELVGLFGSPGIVPSLEHFDGHAFRARRAAETWLELTIKIADSREIAGRALTRVRENIAPAEKGKQSIKDCVVIETYFDLVRRLRADGDQAKVVFLSSNRADYCESKTSLALRAPLAEEFIALNMEFSPNFGAAKHALGL